MALNDKGQHVNNEGQLIYKDDIAKENLERLFGKHWPEVVGNMALSLRSEAILTMPVTIINVGSKRDENQNVIDYGIWVVLGKSRVFIPWSYVLEMRDFVE